MPRASTLARQLLSASLIGLLGACGGSDSTAPKGGKAPLTQAQAATVAASIFEEVSLALANSGFVPASKAPTAARLAAVPVSGSATVNAPCTQGGTITGTYNYTDNFDNNGGGTATGTMSVGMHGCKVSTGTSVIAVDGQLNYSFNFTFSQNTSLDVFDWHGSGSFSWTGGSCSLDYTVHYTGASGGHVTVSGNICGVTVNETA